MPDKQAVMDKIRKLFGGVNSRKDTAVTTAPAKVETYYIVEERYAGKPCWSATKNGSFVDRTVSFRSAEDSRAQLKIALDDKAFGKKVVMTVHVIDP